MTSQELIAALEKATEPDRELDVAIYHLLYPTTRIEGDKYVNDCFLEPMPFYTSSIDAAMTLVPEGHKWKCGYSRHVPHNAEVIDYEGRNGSFVGECDSNRAIALCIASLKSRATSQSGE